MSLGGRVCVSEKCQKSVTYYLNGPYLHRKIDVSETGKLVKEQRQDKSVFTSVNQINYRCPFH